MSGEGATEFGGRLSSPGVSMVYLAQSQALAALEMLVHLDASELLQSYVIIAIGIEERFISHVDPIRLQQNSGQLGMPGSPESLPWCSRFPACWFPQSSITS